MVLRLALPAAIVCALALSGCAPTDGDVGADNAPDVSQSGAAPETSPASGSSEDAPGTRAENADDPTPYPPDPQVFAEETAPVEPLPNDSDAKQSRMAQSTVPIPSTGTPGLPVDSGASVDDVLRTGAVVLRAGDPSNIMLSVPASERCAPAITSVESVAEQVEVTLVDSGTPCGEPNEVQTFTIEVPSDLDGADELGVVVLQEGTEPVEVTVPAPEAIEE